MANTATTWLKFLFVLFLTICCAFIGLVLSKFLIPKSAGLAGGAMVLGYGILGLFIGLIMGFVLKNKLIKSSLSIATAVLGVIALAGLAWTYTKFRASKEEGKRQVAEMKEFTRTHKPTAQAQPITPIQTAPPYGKGMASPQLKENSTLYFYNSFDDHNAVDSISFIKASHGDIVIENMPIWLKPANIKLDYQILYFRSFSQSNNRVQISVNDKTDKKYWVDKSQIKVSSWNDFLLDVFAVEPLDWKINPVRKSASMNAQPIPGINRQNTLRPLKITGEWMEVEIMNQNYEVMSRGWLRWRTKEKLIIEYSLLS